MKITERKKFRNAIVSIVNENPAVAVVEATSSYIPIEQFKEVFNFIGDLVKKERITKLVFDKRKLTVFHQPSMEWYFVEWKEKMFAEGLTIHRKILPKDEIFRQSVRIGREKINKMFPTGKFHQLDISYSETLEDAINK
jgi:hypothetical protein